MSTAVWATFFPLGLLINNTFCRWCNTQEQVVQYHICYICFRFTMINHRTKFFHNICNQTALINHFTKLQLAFKICPPWPPPSPTPLHTHTQPTTILLKITRGPLGPDCSPSPNSNEHFAKFFKSIIFVNKQNIHHSFPFALEDLCNLDQ